MMTEVSPTVRVSGAEPTGEASAARGVGRLLNQDRATVMDATKSLPTRTY